MLLFLISSLFVLSNGVPLQLQPLKSFNTTNLIAKLADGVSAKNLIAKLVDGGSAKNLIAELADADPAKIQEVITLVEAMIGVAQNDLNALTVTSTDANAAYTAAVSTYDAAVVAQTQDELAAKNNAQTLQTAVTDALAVKNNAEGAKTGAQSSLDAEKSRLDAEVASLQQVVTILRGLSASSGEKKVIAQIDFGNLNQFTQEGWYPIGGPDGTGGTISGTVGSVTVTASGYGYMRGAYFPVTSGPDVGISNLLRSSILCNYDCTIQIHITGLTAGRHYSIKSYHHDTNSPRGGAPFSLSWNGGTVAQLKQSANGQAPNPATTYTADVTANVDGRAVLLITSSANKVTGAHVDVNGLEIRG